MDLKTLQNQKSVQEMKKLLDTLDTRQKIGISAGILSVFGFLMYLIFASSGEAYVPLFSSVNEEDAARVVDTLKEDKVPYKLSSRGKILVPSSMVNELRLRMASSGALQGGPGFELFDTKNFGISDFVQNVNFRRALQGELGRTIASLDVIEKARVMLVIPKKRVFLDERVPPSASVALRLKMGSTLSPDQVHGIVGLVSSSVEGLETHRVTIVNQRGVLLAGGDVDKNGAEASTDEVLTLQQEVERKLERKVEDVLQRIVGPGRVVARITAQIDVRKEQRKEQSFDPDQIVVTSERRTRESRMEPNRTGIPGSQGNQPGVVAVSTNQEPASNMMRENDQINYDTNRVESNITTMVTDLEHLSVAVLIDDALVEDESGEMVFKPRTKEEMERLTSLVEQAVGFRAIRGDKVKVVNVRFNDDLLGAEGVAPWAAYVDVAAQYFLPLAIIAVLFFAMRPLISSISKRISPEEEPEEEEEERELTEEELRKKMEDELAAHKGHLSQEVEENKRAIAHIASNDVDIIIHTVKKWLAQSR